MTTCHTGSAVCPVKTMASLKYKAGSVAKNRLPSSVEKTSARTRLEDGRQAKKFQAKKLDGRVLISL